MDMEQEVLNMFALEGMWVDPIIRSATLIQTLAPGYVYRTE